MPEAEGGAAKSYESISSSWVAKGSFAGGGGGGAARGTSTDRLLFSGGGWLGSGGGAALGAEAVGIGGGELGGPVGDCKLFSSMLDSRA